MLVPVYGRTWDLLDRWELICQWRKQCWGNEGTTRRGWVAQYRSRAANWYQDGKAESRIFSSWIDAKSFHTMKQRTEGAKKTIRVPR